MKANQETSNFSQVITFISEQESLLQRCMSIQLFQSRLFTHITFDIPLKYTKQTFQVANLILHEKSTCLVYYTACLQ